MTLEANGLTKAYGPLVAVDDLTFSVGAGEVVGLLGTNGAGKTTAIRVLTTILAPTAGTFAVAGVSHRRPEQIRRRVGVLPESAGYPEGQTAIEYLRYHARLHGHTRRGASTVATTLLADVGLEERGGSRIGRLSRGMRQRLGIARALVNDPAVVFFDEPTLGLDPQGQAQVLRIVQDIARERGATVVLSTHFLAEVEDICTRVLILNRGRKIADGTVGEVTRRAAAPRRGRFRVPADMVGRAIAALDGEARGAHAERVAGSADWVVVALDGAGAASGAQHRIADAVGALAAAEVPLLAFELEGARLSEAFLTMIRAA
jgi:ABC-2 type transport system ATP-binding protein